MDGKILDNPTIWIGEQLKTISDIDELQAFIAENKVIFKYEKAADYYLRCIENHGVSTKNLYKLIASIKIENKELINRSYLAHFLGATKSLSRDNLFIISIFGKLTTEEVSTLLKYANSRDFYDKDVRDLCLKFMFKTRDSGEIPILLDQPNMYNETENFLERQEQRPLCNKISYESKRKTERESFRDCETVFIGKDFSKVNNVNDFEEFLENNADVISDEDVLKFKKVSAYIINCVIQKGMTASEYINKIANEDYVMELSGIYHLFNINNESKVVKGFTRNSIISFGIIGKLNINEINRALKLNNNQPLYVRDLRDLYLAFSILNSISYWETEETLLRNGFEPLNKRFTEEYYGSSKGELV